MPKAEQGDEKVWLVTAPVVPGSEPWSGDVYKRNGRSVQFVNGVARITDELALAVEFPIHGAAIDVTDTSPENPYSPGEALALQLVSDFSTPERPYTVTPKIKRAPDRVRDLSQFTTGVQTPSRPQGMLRPRTDPLAGNGVQT